MAALLTLVYGLAVLAGLALLLGGARLWRRDRRRALLMLLVALVTLLNVWTWSGLVAPRG